MTFPSEIQTSQRSVNRARLQRFDITLAGTAVHIYMEKVTNPWKSDDEFVGILYHCAKVDVVPPEHLR